MDWAGNVNGQVHDTVPLQDFNVHESSKLQFWTRQKQADSFNKSRKKVDKLYESSVSLLRNDWR